MKIALLTSPARCERFSDKSMIPAGAELIPIGEKYTEEEVIARCADAEAIIVDAMSPVTARMIAAMPKLRLIHSEGVSFSLIDLGAATKRGITVCNNKGINAGQVAEQAVLLSLAVLRRLLEGDRMVRAARQHETKMRFIMEGIRDLSDCTVGIVGLGAIGKELAKRLSPFGCKLFYTGRRRADEDTEKAYSVSYLTKEELLRQCDIVSLSLPVTPDTVHYIDREALSLMKPTAILVNCARGQIVDSAALAEAIVSGGIYGAGLDTMDPEPVVPEDPLLHLPEPYNERVVFSPHIAGTTLSVFYNSYKVIWSNMSAVAEGREPINIVNR